MKNVLYFPNFNSIGGIETFCYEFGLKYGKDYDITVLFQRGDAEMMRKISKVCRVIRYRDGDEIICDVFIFGYGHEIIEHVQAKRIIQTFHADYICRHLNPCFDERITDRFGVADNTTNGIREHYEWAKDIVTMYNPYTVKKPRKVLNLVSATRLTPEKGYERMITFADALDRAEIPFRWTIFTDVPKKFPNKSVCMMDARMDVCSIPSATTSSCQLNVCMICTAVLQTRMIVPALMIYALPRDSMDRNALFRLGILYSGSSMMKKDFLIL